MSATQILTQLGQEIRARRTQQLLSQEELAGESGVHTNLVGLLERGSENVTVTTLFKIATALNTTVFDLFAGAALRS